MRSGGKDRKLDGKFVMLNLVEFLEGVEPRELEGFLDFTLLRVTGRTPDSSAILFALSTGDFEGPSLDDSVIQAWT